MNAPKNFFARFIGMTCLALFSVGGQALELKGFRGLAWGADVTQLGPSELLTSQGDVSCYVRSNENLMFGNITLTMVRYCFQQGQFFMVSLESRADSKSVRQEFQRTYGVPSSVTAQMTTWGEKASTSRAELTTLTKGATMFKLYSSQFELATNQTTLPVRAL